MCSERAGDYSSSSKESRLFNNRGDRGYHDIIWLTVETIPLTAFCTPTRLFEWLVMPQGSSGAPGWFVKVINEAIKSLATVAAYLDDVIVFDPDPSAHVLTITRLFKQLRKHNLKLSPSKAKIGATNADLQGTGDTMTGVRAAVWVGTN